MTELRWFAAAVLGALLVALRAEAVDPEPPDVAEEPHPASATEITKQLTNPVSSIWSLTFQQNNFWVDPRTR